jgi:hypothetical protein
MPYYDRAGACMDDAGNVEYYCEMCNTHLQIVDKPCDHEWRASDLGIDASQDILVATIWRHCPKCTAIQKGIASVRWLDA